MRGCARLLASCWSAGARRSIASGARLQALSPLATLNRGYAIVRSRTEALRDAAAVRPGDALDIQLAAGSLAATVDEVRP